MPEGAVYVGRPTKWGNPWRVGGAVGADIDEPKIYRAGARITPQLAVDLYQSALLLPGTTRGVLVGLVEVGPLDVYEELRGKDLVCWCGLDQPCHADVLLAVANA
jgi:hypothetical protein